MIREIKGNKGKEVEKGWKGMWEREKGKERKHKGKEEGILVKKVREKEIKCEIIGKKMGKGMEGYVGKEFKGKGTEKGRTKMAQRDNKGKGGGR